jgi:hypothetical protein
MASCHDPAQYGPNRTSSGSFGMPGFPLITLSICCLVGPPRHTGAGGGVDRVGDGEVVAVVVGAVG